MTPLRFAVIGDTHYCRLRSPAGTGRPALFDRLPDALRYDAMTREVLPSLAAELTAWAPEFVVSTGDLIEGGGPCDEEDDRMARALFAGVPAFHLAPGTHDLPRRPGERRYRSFVVRGARFVLLDYTDWGEPQRAWLSRELAAARDATRLFVFGHPPLHLFGRHFFDNPVFRREAGGLLAAAPVDVYFCGHTHLQSVSRHDGMIQAVGSAVGSPSAPAIPLERLHTPPEPEAGLRYYWGMVEDSAPGFYTVEAGAEEMVLGWHSPVGRAELRLPARHAPPARMVTPRFAPAETVLSRLDALQVCAGWLHVFSANPGENGSSLALNGVPLGPVPENANYAGRRYAALPEEALQRVGEDNELAIVFPSSPTFAVGSFSLELSLMDGRNVHSAVAPELFVCGASPDFAYAEHRAERVGPRDRRTVVLRFGSAEAVHPMS